MPDPHRNRELAKIHLGKKFLAWDDETYREVMYRVTGQRSAGDLDRAGRHKLLDYMKGQGFAAKPETKAGTARNKILAGIIPEQESAAHPDPFDAVKAAIEVKEGEKPQVVLIDALWADLAKRGAFRHGIHASLPTFMERSLHIHVSHPIFCTPEDCNKIIEALKSWLRRHVKQKGAQ